MNPVRQAIRFAMQTVCPRRRLLVRGPRRPQPGLSGEVVSGRSTARPEIALTFDDGPHPEHTPRLLDELARLDMKATFFVIGFDAALYPDVVRRMAREGHAVGNHTWMHTEPAETGTAQFLEEVSRTRGLLEDLTGADCTLVRPPKGKLTPAKLAGLWRQRQTTVLWSVDPKDYQMKSEQEITAWAELLQCRQGDVILMHDSRPWAVSTLARLASTGVRAVSIPEWLNRKPADQTDGSREPGEAGSEETGLGHGEPGAEPAPATIPLPDRGTGRGLFEELANRCSRTRFGSLPEDRPDELATLPMYQNQQVPQ